MSTDKVEIAEDTLRGIKSIADFIGETERRTQYLCETKQIPIGKLGRLYIGSKIRLREHYSDLTSGNATE